MSNAFYSLLNASEAAESGAGAAVLSPFVNNQVLIIPDTNQDDLELDNNFSATFNNEQLEIEKETEFSVVNFLVD